MLIGNKQTFYICKATCSKRQVSTFVFSLIDKEELMAYASSPQNKNTKVHVSSFSFLFAKKQKTQVSLLVFPFCSYSNIGAAKY